MTGAELAEIEARANDATPGPWKNDCKNGLGERVVRPLNDINGGYAISNCHGDDMLSNSEFIAHAREDIPRLIEEVRKLKALLAANFISFEPPTQKDIDRTRELAKRFGWNIGKELSNE